MKEKDIPGICLNDGSGIYKHRVFPDDECDEWVGWNSSPKMICEYCDYYDEELELKE